MQLSFITIIKNRTNIVVDHDGQKIELKLFENNLRSLLNILQPSDQWEYNIIDFESTDVNMQDFIDTLPKFPNLQFKIHTIPGKFDKGIGLNLGKSVASYPIVFFLDADMLIRTRSLFDDIEQYVMNEHKVFFPLCWYYFNPEHTKGRIRYAPKGNVIQRKETIMPYVVVGRWGLEDLKNFEYFDKQGLVIRKSYGEQFAHQWHPDELRHLYYKK